MGLFSRAPKPDPVGDICRLLVERPWEWDPMKGKKAGLRHLSGVWLMWDTLGSSTTPARVWCGNGPDSVAERVPERAAQRLHAAFVDHAAARLTRPRVPLPAAAQALARKVLDGDPEAARALADMVCELVNEKGAWA